MLRHHLIALTRQALGTAALVGSFASITLSGALSPDFTSPDKNVPPGNPHAQEPNGAGPGGITPGTIATDDAHQIPVTALSAYKRATASVAPSLPECHISWEIIAGIGRIESVHASAYGLRSDGSTERPILGPRLDGHGFALVQDTEKGEWDGDAVFDRAIGPLQFIPSTWKRWQMDGNGDGVRDPGNIFDASLGSAMYLCSDRHDLANASDLSQAILSYNNSREYLNDVLHWIAVYRNTPPPASPPVISVDPLRGPPAPLYPRPAAVDAGQAQATHPLHPHPVAPSPRPHSSVAPAVTPPATVVPSPHPLPSAERATRLQRLGPMLLACAPDEIFASSPRVRAINAHQDPVSGKPVIFKISGNTDARFLSGRTEALVRTAADGSARAPGSSPARPPGFSRSGWRCGIRTQQFRSMRSLCQLRFPGPTRCPRGRLSP